MIQVFSFDPRGQLSIPPAGRTLTLFSILPSSGMHPDHQRRTTRPPQNNHGAPCDRPFTFFDFDDISTMHNGLLGVVALAIAGLTDARHAPAFKHKALRLGRRQDQPLGGPPDAFPPTTSSAEVLAFVTPYPGATPVAITSQSQEVTVQVPQFTLCALPPVAEVPVPPTATPAPYGNYSTQYTASWDTGTGSCTTEYSSSVTTVCATVLDGIATKYIVTSCSQEITFSSQYGYTLVTPTPTATANSTNGTIPFYGNTSTITAAPSIQTLTTYFLAPWQELTTAGPPNDIDKKICTTYGNGSEICLVEFQRWVTIPVTHVSTTVTSIDFTTMIFQPSQLIFEIITANITETLSTYSLSIAVEVSYTVETETTTRVTRPVSTGPTVYTTATVEMASET